MRVAVDYEQGQLEFEAADDRVIGAWHGPPSVAPGELSGLVREALRSPLDFPPLNQIVVPGDTVALAVDRTLAAAPELIAVVSGLLHDAGIEDGSIQLVSVGDDAEGSGGSWAPGMAVEHHRPADKNQLAYLASTRQGRRIYLNRRLIDADVVVPLGRVGFDPVLGYRGPWSVIFPGASDEETRRSIQSQAAERTPRPDGGPGPALAESAEVSWLLGSQFHVGVVAGQGGVARVLAGLETSVRAAGIAALSESWTFRVDQRADVVVAGVGGPDRPSRIEDLAAGLAAAQRLVQRGGKIVLLSQTGGSLGPSLQRLAAAGDPRLGPAALRGAEGEPDFTTARLLARALAWADVYLWSALDESDVSDLSMIPLDRPEQARKLVQASHSCLFLSQADLTRTVVEEPDATSRGEDGHDPADGV